MAYAGCTVASEAKLAPGGDSCWQAGTVALFDFGCSAHNLADGELLVAVSLSVQTRFGFNASL